MAGTAERTKLGGTFTFPGTEMTVHRMGYGAMQLAGKGVFGPPKDRDGAVRVLRAAVEAGVNHIDTSDFYGPHVTNQIIREALHPYPEGLVIVTKVGAKRNDRGAWLAAQSRQELIDAVEDNLKNLGLEVLDVVNFRVHTGAAQGTKEGPVAEQVTALAELQQQGKIKHVGISNATPTQFREANGITPIVCVQNMYNVANRGDDGLIDELAEQSVAYVPFFPLGGAFVPLKPEQTAALGAVGQRMGKTAMQVALAWLLQRSPNVLLIPGTSSVEHLQENLGAAEVELSDEVVNELDAIGKKA